jgi:hypothetical protein
VYAWSLLAFVLVVLGVLVALGSSLPAPGPLLLLALPLALCMNRYLFFPNEIGVTADAAVLFAAVVAFRSDAPWLGPLVLALLVGPLDARHWGERAWIRMAYNSGSTALTTAAALAVYTPLSRALGAGWDAILGAAVAAAVAYALAELGLGVALVTLLGERPSDATRHQLPLDALSLPLALVGATAGLAAIEVGWWLAAAVLLPVAFVPELVFIAAPRRGCGRSSAVAATSGLLLVASLLVAGTSAMGVQLVAVGLLAGLECRVVRRRPFPLLAVPVALAAAIVSASDALLAVAAVAVVAAVVAAWWCAAPNGSLVRPEAMFWSIPLFATSGFAASAWSARSSGGAVLFLAVMGWGLVTIAAAGATPWRSRHVARWVTGWSRRARSALLVTAISVTAAASVLSLTLDTDGRGWTHLAAASVEVVLGAAAVAVRQWRFAPRRRRRDGALLVVASILVVIFAAPGGFGPGVAVAVIAVAAATAILVARPLDRVLAEVC